MISCVKRLTYVTCIILFFQSGECLVCSLKLCEQISTSNQGLLLFECGKLVYVKEFCLLAPHNLAFVLLQKGTL